MSVYRALPFIFSGCFLFLFASSALFSSAPYYVEDDAPEEFKTLLAALRSSTAPSDEGSDPFVSPEELQTLTQALNASVTKFDEFSKTCTVYIDGLLGEFMKRCSRFWTFYHCNGRKLPAPLAEKFLSFLASVVKWHLKSGRSPFLMNRFKAELAAVSPA